MRKYISPRIEEIMIKADVIATSGGDRYDETISNGASQLAPDRYGRSRYDADFDLY